MLLARQRPAARRQSSPTLDKRQADETFLQLLIAQARLEAARQSQDRLSGWAKAIQARFEAQSAPALDVEIIRYAEARMAAEAARFEAERGRAAAQTNALLGRPVDSALVAVLQSPPPGNSTTERTRPFPDALQKLEEEILPQGRELLNKLHQSYLFGGTPLNALLWQEQQVYHTEVEYRVWLAKDEVEPWMGVWIITETGAERPN